MPRKLIIDEFRREAKILNQVADLLDEGDRHPVAQPAVKHHHVSKAARLKMSRAQKARWAEVKAGLRRAA